MIFCGHFLSNARSARVQQKCGFRHYAFDTFKTQYGTVEQDEFSALSREEWLARQDEGRRSGA